MDDALKELQSMFMAAQNAKPKARLAERNVVELVNKLQSLGLLKEALLHTVNGKEYITQERLRKEVEREIYRLGRASLVDIAAVIGVDLYHCEKQAHAIVASNPDVSMAQGEVITTGYWDGVAEEVSETLQETGQVSLAELAQRFNVGSELLLSVLEPRMSTLVQGTLEGGQLYTPVHVARQRAMARGAIRAVTVPTPATSIWSTIQRLQQLGEGGSAVEGGGALSQSVFTNLVAEGAARGSMRSGIWTPNIFAQAQVKSVEAFFSQNGYISYSMLQKVGVPQPRQYAQTKYPEGLALATAFVHPSLLGQVEATAEEALAAASWCDASQLVPTSFSPVDVAELLRVCPCVRTAEKEGTATIMADTCLVSEQMVKDIVDRFVKAVGSKSAAATRQTQQLRQEPKGAAGEDDGESWGDGAGGSQALGEEKDAKAVKGRKGKKEKKGEETKQRAREEEEDEGEGDRSSRGSKKGGKRNKGGKGGGGGGGKEATGGKAPAASGVSRENEWMPKEEEMVASVLEWYPDMEITAEGSDGMTLAQALVHRVRSAVAAAILEARRVALTAGTEQRRQLREASQRRVEEAYASFHFYSRALEVFESDTTTMPILCRHLLRTVGAELADTLLLHQDIERQVEEGELPADTELPAKGAAPMTNNSRIALAKKLPGAMGAKAKAVAEAVEGKTAAALLTAVEDSAEESGIRLRKLDKKAESARLQAEIKEFATELEAEESPIQALPLVVSLMFAKSHRRVLQMPGRAISAVIAKLKENLPEAVAGPLAMFHSDTVELLSSQSGLNTAAGDEANSARAKLQSRLVEALPSLKSAALSL